MCIINNTDSSVVTTTTLTQNIDMSAIGPGSQYIIQCSGGLDITQTAGLTVNKLAKLSQTDQNSINQIVQNGLKNTADQIGQIKDGYQGTSEGGQFLSTIQNKITTSLQKGYISNNLTTALSKYSTTQVIDQDAINGGFVQLIVDGACTLDQNSYMKLQLADIISGAYTNDIMDSVTSFLTSKTSQDTSVISSGAPCVTCDVFKNNWMIIVGAVVVLVLGVGLIGILKSKRVQDAIAKQMSQASKAEFSFKRKFR